MKQPIAQQVISIAIGAIVLAGCQQQFPTATSVSPAVPAASTVAETAQANSTAKQQFRVDVFATGLDVPWDIEPAPGGRIFVTERPGRLRVIRNGKLDPKPYATLPEVVAKNQGGLMDMVLHPQYDRNKLVYLSYTVETGSKMHTRISRFRDTGSGLTDKKIIFNADPVDSTKHFGGRMGFGPDGKLYFTLGERGKWDKAQDLGNINGKTLRINDDGTVPKDNPFVNRSGAKPQIFSYGNRNAQSLDFQPGTGLIFSAEHGPSGNDRPGGGDEINIIEAGKNYGWPVIHHDMTKAGMVSPIIQFTPATAAGGATFYSGNLFPSWKGNFFVANLRSQSLQRIVLNGRKVAGIETLLQNQYGRLRTVAEDKNGYLYVSTSNGDGYGSGQPGQDKILRLSPVR
ncbi:MAG: PQQ-dependent sugar dehydrogenase [Microcoleus sp.]